MTWIPKLIEKQRKGNDSGMTAAIQNINENSVEKDEFINTKKLSLRRNFIIHFFKNHESQ